MQKIKKRPMLHLFLTMLLIVTILFGCSQPLQNTNSKTNDKGSTVSSGPENKPSSDNTTTTINGTLKVHYIDVGQADCILIQQGSLNMLIDAGNNGDASAITSYLQKQNIKKIDILVGTHPHEDHIGSLDAVINTFEIGQIYMPKASSNTKTFEDVLNAINKKGLKVTTPVPGNNFSLGDAKCVILAPNSSSYQDVNNYSIVIKLTYGTTSFMFDGDAEDVSEKEILTKGFDIKADVLKLGHHGSNSSTTVDFLAKVNPRYAVISVGKGNSYGHPHKETMERLQTKGIKVYRTDQGGTVIAISDGKTIKFEAQEGNYNFGSENTSNSTSTESPTVKPNPPPTTSDNNTLVVFKTKSGSKYHMDSCRYLSSSKIQTTVGDAKAAGLTPCSVCNPPQ